MIYKYIARQFGNPTGFGGKISTLIMNCLNQKLYKTVIENLDIRETDTILDIGFGNGYLIGRLSKKRIHKLYGIDISTDMVRTASRKYPKSELKLADVIDLPFASSSIDKAYTINTVYFWSDVGKGFSEIQRVLKPDGIFLNVIYVKEWLDKLPMTQYGFTKFTTEQIERATTESGLKIERIIEIERGKSVCVVARNIT